MKNKNKKRQKSGFTMIEILIVIAIIGFIAAAGSYLFVKAREDARIARNLQFSNSVRAGLANAPLAYWNFDGGTASDSWGSKNGTISGATSVDGVVGKALYFNGSSYVDFGDIIDFEISDSFTISFWVKFNNISGVLISKWAYGCGAGWYVNTNSSKVGLTFNGDNCNWIIVSEPTSPSLNKWYYYAITYNGSGNGNGIKIYRDGTPGQTVSVNTAIDTIQNNLPLRLGSRSSNSLYFDKGSLDEVRIYGESLNARQVQELYAESASRHGLALK